MSVMKKLLIALAVIGTIHISANAQSKSPFDVNYKVCRVDSKYKTCDANDPAVVTTTSKATTEQKKVEQSLRRMDTYVHLGYRPSNVVSNKRNPRIVVMYDDPNGAYEGKSTQINDGVQKNKVRNVNYLDTSVDLPSNDGN
jgi:hypothetical protein